MSQKIYEMINDRILELLEKGICPWSKPWSSAGQPRNLISRREYRGINFLLLSSLGFSSPYFLTFKQCKALGGHVKKGAKGFPVVFWKFFRNGTDENDESETPGRSIPMLRYFTVFNLEQCEGIPESKIPALPELKEHNPIEAAEAIVAGMPSRPVIQYTKDPRAYYSPLCDLVNMPHREDFRSPEEMYSTLFHELTHSTGHTARLGRKSLTSWAPFGSDSYGREELVAEMGAGYLCAHAGIENRTIENSAAYIASWLRALKADPRAVVIAAGQAQKAADFILARKEDEEEEGEE